MKEYRIVCTCTRTDQSGNVKVFENTAPHIGSGQLPHFRIFKTTEEAIHYLQFCKEKSKDFCKKSRENFSMYPKIYSYKYKETKIRIQSRDVTEWED